jgi:hypothetical protein
MDTHGRELERQVRQLSASNSKTTVAYSTTNLHISNGAACHHQYDIDATGIIVCRSWPAASEAIEQLQAAGMLHVCVWGGGVVKR